ncbi:MAG: hypothetical protein AB7Q29_14895 [Vicinamibacterales bacterium]
MPSALDELPHYCAGWGGVPCGDVEGERFVQALWYVTKHTDATFRVLACGLYRVDEETFALRIFRNDKPYRRITGGRAWLEAQAVEKWRALLEQGWA